MVARHRAEAGADFAALAGAAQAIEGQQVVCARAGKIASANLVRVERCGLAGMVVTVQVSRTLDGVGLSHWRAHAQARAGPAP